MQKISELNMAGIILSALHLRNIRISIAAALAMTLAMMQDFIRYHFYGQSAFHISESFLFESFWILFAPMFAGIYYCINAFRVKFAIPKFLVLICVTLAASALHFLLFAFGVYAISSLSQGHVFQFKDVLHHGLAEYLYICLLIYLAGCIYMLRFTIPAALPKTTLPESKAGLARINITIGTNNIMVETSEIILITASSPYSCIHTAKGKYLYPQTLKLLEQNLDPASFLRVHKSSIVNIKRVLSYKSRLNGDYDLILENGQIVRMSRNYKLEFRNLFS
ncbi:LytTR family DNA-binding domain-containing protein [Dyadobacter sp. CY326]|uniref:LytR/AlgR family response regulator transcription factor n=1 Tax=Dyadobacter sp. CY326 TaxID=2907300 RepID=UPI001F44C5FC|nr:LytTR family DNA-binding domain-containing protein [Dyadobacter sp. CY326]MCE7063845.1 LytTR family transcriptional regulator [Dyadobacter sp. CY326]